MKKIKCGCGNEAVKRYGFCRRCLKIRDEIANEKASENKKTCKDCEFYRKLNQAGKHRCTWNNNVYTSTIACFGFKRKQS